MSPSPLAHARDITLRRLQLKSNAERAKLLASWPRRDGFEDARTLATHPLSQAIARDHIRQVQRQFPGLKDAKANAFLLVRATQNTPYAQQRQGVASLPELIRFGAGICQDTAAAIATYLFAVGWQCLLVAFPPSPTDPVPHLGVAMEAPRDLQGRGYSYGGRRYLYLEPTAPIPIGTMPPDLWHRRANIWHVTPAPNLILSGRAETNRGRYRITINVLNNGSAAATKCTIQMRSIGPDGSVTWAGQRSTPRLSVGNSWEYADEFEAIVARLIVTLTHPGTAPERIEWRTSASFGR